MATAPASPIPSAGDRSPTEESWDLTAILAVLKGHRRVILATVVLALIAGGVTTFRAPKLYPAHATLIIQSDTSRFLSAQDPLGSGSPFADEFFQTQYRRIASQSVVERAIKAAKMDEWEEFETVSDLPGCIAGGIQLSPIRDSRMVGILYEGPNPENAVKLVNAVIDSFETEFREDRRKEAQTGVSSLGGSLTDIEDEINRRENALREYMKANNVTTTDPNFSVPYLQLQDVTRGETALMRQTFELDAQVAQMEKSGSDIQLPLGMDGVADQQRFWVSLLTDRDKALQTYRADSPEVMTLDKQIKSVRDNIKAGVIGRRDSLKAALAETRKKKVGLEAEVQQINQRFIEVDRLRSNLRQAQDRYQEVMAGQARGQVFGQMAVSPVLVIERPTVAQVPSKPRRTRDMAVALMFGLVLGVGLAFAIEFLDDSVRSAEDIRKAGGVLALGVLPQIQDIQGSAEKLQLVSKHPHATTAEAIRRLRTLLDLGFPPEPGRARVFLVTSAQAGEGKTTLSVNLALAMAQNNRRVLWLDADLRHATDPALLGLEQASQGLAEYLSGQGTPEEFVRPSPVPSLEMLPAGHATKNAGELLTHARLGDLMQWARERYAVIVLDSPPVLLVSDALVLSPLADAGLLVVSGAKTRRSVLHHAVQVLQQVGLQLAGTIINDPVGRLQRAASRYGYGYGYGYGYSEGYYRKEGADGTAGEALAD